MRARIFVLNPGPVREVAEVPPECRFKSELHIGGGPSFFVAFATRYTHTQINLVAKMIVWEAADYAAEAEEQARIASVARTEAEDAAELPPYSCEPARAFEAARIAKGAADAAWLAADSAKRLASGSEAASHARYCAQEATGDAAHAEEVIDRWYGPDLDRLAVGVERHERHPKVSVRRTAGRAGRAVNAYVARQHEAPAKILRELDRAILAYERERARYTWDWSGSVTSSADADAIYFASLCEDARATGDAFRCRGPACVSCGVQKSETERLLARVP